MRHSAARAARWIPLVVLVSVGSLAPSCRPTPRPSAAPVAPPGHEPAPRSSPEAPLAADAPGLPLEPPADAEHLPSGVAMRMLARGDAEGPTPRRSDRLELRFWVWDEEDALVGTTGADRSETLAAFWLPPGWLLAMEQMHEGDRAQIWVPAALAYPGHAEGPRGALRIDVELLAILRSEGEPEPTQGPQLRPPPNALFTATGLSFLVLREGSGTRHPGPQTTVTVHYEGWTSDGKSFDSSRARGRPASFRLDRVIAGWQEGVQLMVEGETTRFWIPAELAYGNKPGRPQGMLIFDVELISIDD